MSMGTSYHNSDPALDHLSDFDESGKTFKEFYDSLGNKDDAYGILGLVHNLIRRGYNFSEDEQNIVKYLIVVDKSEMAECGVDAECEEQHSEFMSDWTEHIEHAKVQ